MEKGSEICKKKYFSSLSHICNHLPSIYTGTYLLGLCRGQVYLDNSGLLPFDYLLKSILTLSHSLKPSSSIHSLQIHCIGLIRLEFTYLIGIVYKPSPYNWRHLWEEFVCQWVQQLDMAGSGPHQENPCQRDPQRTKLVGSQQQGNFPDLKHEQNQENERNREGSVNTTQTSKSHSQVGSRISQRQNSNQTMQ